MKRLSNNEYQAKKRKELEQRAKNGTIDEEMRPYLEYLKGDRNRRTKADYRYHRKAQRVIKRLHENFPLYVIGSWSDSFSVSAVQRLYAGKFDSISEQYAETIYHALRGK